MTGTEAARGYDHHLRAPGAVTKYIAGNIADRGNTRDPIVYQTDCNAGDENKTSNHVSFLPADLFRFNEFDSDGEHLRLPVSASGHISSMPKACHTGRVGMEPEPAARSSIFYREIPHDCFQLQLFRLLENQQYDRTETANSGQTTTGSG